MIGEVLGHPLFLLTAGALLSGWFIPRLTQRWQDQRKALEIRADLVERVSQSVSEMMMAVQLVQVGARSFSQNDFDAEYEKWQKDKAVLTSLLRAYFKSDEVDREWIQCRSLTTAYYVQTGIFAEERRHAYLDQVARGIALAKPKDWSEEVMSEEDMGELGANAEPSEQVIDLRDLSVHRQQVRDALDRTVEAIVGRSIAV